MLCTAVALMHPERHDLHLAARTQWGNGVFAFAGHDCGNYPVYGRIATGQNTLAGIYTDILTVTLNY